MLHIDKNDYYGGAEAALSLQEVESWADTADQGKVDACLSWLLFKIKQVRPSGMLRLTIWRENEKRRKEATLRNWAFPGHTASRYPHS